MAHWSARFKNRFIFRSARAQVLASDPENWATPPVIRPRRPTRRIPCAVRELRSVVAGFGGSGELGGGEVAGPGQVVDLVVAFGQQAGGFQPPEDVPATVGAGQPDVFTDRQGHRAAGPVDLAGELDAGGRRADHEDLAGRELAGITVGERGEGRDRRGDGVGDGGDRRPGAGPGGQHHGPGPDEVIAGPDLEASWPGAQGMHGGGGADRRADQAGVTGQGGGDAGGGHEPVGVIAGVVVAGQPGLPVGGE